MIAKIKRGQKLAGLVSYLLGRGEHNEHVDRHIIGGSPTVMREMWLEHFDGPGDDEVARETALAVAGEIEIPRRLYKTAVRMKAKPVAVGVGGRELGMDVVEPAGRGEKGQYRDAPVWHCVLALTPGEELTDERWAEVIDTFMDRMGFTGTADGKRAQARWVAVRHGLSGEQGEGQDHIHIAASLVREDGSKVSTYDYGAGKAKGDWKRADEVCGELEREFGLQVLASRKEGGGLSQNSRAEIERAKKLGTPETERERLRRTVRAVAVAADSEQEFVEGLREAGVAVAPRWAGGGRTAVTGYKVRLRRGGEEVGPWLGGGTLAKDLTLTALREQQWDDTPDGRADALAAWRGRAAKTSGRGAASADRDLDRDIEGWRQAGLDARRWRETLAEVPAGDRAQWAYAAGQAAGVFAAWSELLEGDVPGPFAAAANELTRSAQPSPDPTYRGVRYRRPMQSEHAPGFGDTAKLLLRHTFEAGMRLQTNSRVKDPGPDLAVVLLAAMLVLLILAIAVAVEVARAHRARGELARAVAVEGTLRQHMDPVQQAWVADLQARREQWDRDAGQVFTAAAERRAARVVDAETTVEPAATQDPRETARERAKARARQVIEAANAPLTPPGQKPGDTAAAARRRTYYTEMTDDQKAMWRANIVARAGFGRHDLNPKAWSDPVLERELAQRGEEVQLLRDDIAARRVQGPYAEQAVADNATLRQQATAIPAAQKAQKTAEDRGRDEQQLTLQRERLENQIAALPARRALARRKLASQLETVQADLAEAATQARQARTAADTTAAAVGAPAHQWRHVLHEATEDRQKRRLADATAKDRRELSEDSSYLKHLQDELGTVQAEHDRRTGLTPRQRATEDRDRARGAFERRRSVGPIDTSHNMPHQLPDYGRDRGQGQGFER